MKKTILLAIIGLNLIACSTDDNVANTNETYELRRITENNTTINVDQTILQDKITITNDSLFYRVRRAGTEQQHLQGHYSLMRHNDNSYLILKYDTPNSQIGNCSGNQNEVFMFTSESDIKNTWDECGGPSLEYQRTETE